MSDHNFNPGLSLNCNSKDTNINAIKQLKALFIDDLKKRCPSLPDIAVYAPSFNDKTSNGLTKCVIDFLRLSGYFVERTGNEGRVIDNRQTVTDCIGRTKIIGSIKRIPSSGTPGTSDLKAIIRGKFVAIEIKCKVTNDRIKPDQLRYKLQVEKAGGIYYIVSTFQQFYDWFNSNFVEVKP
jgi:hypothetical protein